MLAFIIHNVQLYQSKLHLFIVVFNSCTFSKENSFQLFGLNDANTGELKK